MPNDPPRTKYRGTRISVFEMPIDLGDGITFDYEYAVFHDSVAILAIDGDGQVVLVDQFRYVLDKRTLDLPGGKVEHDEDILEAAKKELREETGYTAKKWVKLTHYPMHSGRLQCSKTVFLAMDLELGEQDLEPEEQIKVVQKPLRDVVDLIVNGEIIEPTIQVAIWLYLAKSAQGTDLGGDEHG